MTTTVPKERSNASTAAVGALLAGGLLACAPVEESRRLDLRSRSGDSGVVSQLSSSQSTPREEAPGDSEESETDASASRQR